MRRHAAQRVDPELSQHKLTLAQSMCATMHCAQACGQFIEAEWFDEIVVGSRVQAFDAIGYGIAGGDGNDRRRVIGRAQLPKKIEPIVSAQAQIEQHGVERSALPFAQSTREIDCARRHEFPAAQGLGHAAQE